MKPEIYGIVHGDPTPISYAIKAIESVYDGGPSLRDPVTDLRYWMYRKIVGETGALRDVTGKIVQARSSLVVPKYPYTRVINNMYKRGAKYVFPYVMWDFDNVEYRSEDVAQTVLDMVGRYYSLLVWQNGLDKNENNHCSIKTVKHWQILVAWLRGATDSY